MRGYLISIWSIFDQIYFKFTRLSYLSNQGEEENIFRVRPTRYKGRSLTLSDGTNIQKNDMVIKIHFHNVRLLAEIKNVNNEIVKAKVIYKHVTQSLPGVEQYIRSHKNSDNIKGILGITSLNRGCQLVGFEVFNISNPLYKIFKFASFLPISILFGSTPSFRKKTLPSYLFMSKEKLASMYRLNP
ncbi:YkoP family protein [Halobacillus seohaensis]|uniref:YkoP-like domain-containing protein n=1 Tax=Halobacillus seohaensis TaxID=447421 RepID=A0ABW2EH62_9BACI